jgi:hypothetical protein
MKKRIVYIVLALSACLTLLIGYTIYDSEYSSKAVVGIENVKKIKDVQIGMDSLSVLAIMGRPNDKYVFKGETFYNYEVPSGSSYQAQIILDKSGKVNYISAVPHVEE